MDNLWPFKVSVKKGFSCSQLENIVDPEGIKRIDRELGVRSLPYLYWVSEINGFGKCYRDVLDFPWFVPIPIYGDHGVCFLSYFEPHEEENRCSYHLSWYRKRVESLRKKNLKKVIHIPHPWILYRRKNNIRLSENPSGTLVFYSHSNVGIEVRGLGEDYFSSLRSLPREYHPIVICLHQHDILKGVHKQIESHGFPIVTAGSTSSTLFVDRFYSLIRMFKFATSPLGGSEVFYCHELGVKYFVFGSQPRVVNVSHAQKPLGDLESNECLLTSSSNRVKRKLFSKDVMHRSDLMRDRDEFVDEVLGLDLGGEFELPAFRRFVLLQVVISLPRYFYSVVFRFVKKVIRV